MYKCSLKTATSVAVPIDEQTHTELETASSCVQEHYCSNKQKQRKTELPKRDQYCTGTRMPHTFAGIDQTLISNLLSFCFVTSSTHHRCSQLKPLNICMQPPLRMWQSSNSTKFVFNRFKNQRMF